ncbi:lysin A, glycosyl hydrolase domain [Gordonia phage Lilbeanie]|uniref:Lysin A, glycosyl hydrolase domain n=1 Tax=Gordonia phage Lilbeanie TaxID=2794947 RepID=A0A7T1KS91_9CAUD|nr:lysin A, glycosyl hydrolase domain [Gordonia phage Lilbeanie]QPO17116.1 lysin A, glycosyl hydrolase domain [Gordonia phage Lilbeanie]
MDAQTLAGVMGWTLKLERYEALCPAFNEAMLQAGIVNQRRAAQWCAQLGHESGGLRWMEEIASGSAYEGRGDLGNTRPGDGVRFKGRGPIQITGRHNYTALSRWAFERGYVPSATFFVDQPHRLADDTYGFLGPVWYWTVARPTLNAVSDRGDTVAATRLINGGTNGLSDRQGRYRAALGFGDAILPTSPNLLGFTDSELAEFATHLRQLGPC